MSATTSLLPAADAADPAAVTVALLGPTVPGTASLRSALSATSRGGHGWQVLDADGLEGAGTQVHIVVCDDGDTAVAAARRWPGAAVVALTTSRYDGARLEALGTPSVLWLPGGDVGRVAAYVRSIARRRGLVVEDVRP